MEELPQHDRFARPFVAAPDPDRYFPATAIEEARRKITRAIDRGEGPTLLIGGTGTGKSLLLEVLTRHYSNKTSCVLLIGAQVCTRRSLFQSILFQLDLPYRDLDEGELRLALLEHLRPRNGQARRLLLLVDEADSLPTRLLEELRALTNISVGGQLLLSMVLVGSAVLEERFTDPDLDALTQRISHRCYLAALGRDETFQYLRAQVAAVGIDPQKLFTDDGLDAIFTATDGVPRLINQLGDQLIWIVEETGCAPVDATIVQQAWSELQQLPAPWNLKNIEFHDSSVEYGELGLEEDDFVDDDSDEMPALLPISGRQTKPSYGEGIEYLDSIATTETLMEEFESLQPNIPTVELDAHSPQATRNPFAEDFELEEPVVDRYQEFEAALLARAPRVVNRLDSVFSEQLHTCEGDLRVKSAASAEAITQEPPSEQQPIPHVLENLGSTQVIEFEALNPLENVTLTPGDILIVEDDESRGPEIVPSRNYRRLFSSLEKGTRPTRFA